MTSILKVSTIQNTAGGAPTAGDLGLNVTGSVLQVVNATSTTSVEVAGSTVYTAVNPSVTITPSSSSSKILIMHNAGGMVYSNTLDIRFKMFRNGTEILVINRYGYKDGTSQWAPCPFAVTFLDSPATKVHVHTLLWLRQVALVDNGGMPTKVDLTHQLH